MVETIVGRLKEWPSSVSVADADANDLPLIYVNEAFTDLTGFEPGGVIGRNCRFLQTPDTDPTEVDKIRGAIDTETSVTACLLNKRKDGSLFQNLLFLQPLHVVSGRKLVIGCQFEVSPDIAAGRVQEEGKRIEAMLSDTLAETNAVLRIKRDSLRARADATQMLVRSHFMGSRAADSLDALDRFPENED